MLSTIISEILHPKAENFDALVYPCVNKKTYSNTCFNGENVKDLLDFQFVLLMEKSGSDFVASHIIENFSETGEAVYRETSIRLSPVIPPITDSAAPTA